MFILEAHGSINDCNPNCLTMESDVIITLQNGLRDALQIITHHRQEIQQLKTATANSDLEING